MEIIWKRDPQGTSQAQISYIDLFASLPEDEEFNGHLENVSSILLVKDNEQSTAEREVGDSFYDVGDFLSAIRMYTMSLRFAEIGTENVGLAYAKRSTAFFYANMYKESLADTELAKNSKVPVSLLGELEERKTSSLLLEKSVRRQPEDEPTLDYTGHRHFPGAAIVVDLNCNPEFGRHLVANTDIPQGKIILLEENYAMNHLDDMGVCYTCFHSYENFIACEGCVLVTFCSPACRDRNKTHSYECGSFFGIVRDVGEAHVQEEWFRAKLVIQTIFNALAAFDNVEALMEFVEKMLREDRAQLPSSMLDATLKYHFYFKMKQFVVPSTLVQAKHIYMYMMKLPKIRELFNTQEKQRFLMHLVAHHMFVNDTNALGNEDAIVVNNVCSMLNHSCEPNVVSLEIRTLKGVKTTRPVKKGEQLFISYLSANELQLTKSERQRELRRGWGFDCKCTRCKSE